MGLLQSIPSTDQFTGILGAITGDEASGTGVAGVLKLLRGMDTPNLSASLSSQLDGAVSASVSLQPSGVTGGVTTQFEEALRALPRDPQQLLKPLTDALQNVQRLSSDDLAGQMLSGVSGLQELQALVPADTTSLLTEVAGRLDTVKNELISGGFAELREWSQSVASLDSELVPLFTGPAADLRPRLIAYLAKKVADLVRAILPDGFNPGAVLGGLIDQAISAEKLSLIASIRADLVAALDRARAELQMGNTSNTLHLAAAEDAFGRLLTELTGIVSGLRAALDSEAGRPDSLSAMLARRIADFKNLEIIDVGNIKETLTQAIGKVEEAIRGVDLQVVRRTIEEVFAKLDGLIDTIDLRQFTSKLSELTAKLEEVLGAIDGVLLEVTATLRGAFVKVRDALRSVASSLGSFDESGTFHFHVEKDITEFLDTIKQTLHDTIEPIITTVRTTIGDALQQVQTILTDVHGQIESVRGQLEEALQGVRDQLQSLDVPGTIAQARDQLDTMLGELGTIDFDIVVDPVIAQINEMRDALRDIDLSSLNEVIIGGLKVSLKVVVDLDFTGQITAALMTEIDKILAIPRNALGEIETKVEGVISAFATLAPEALLKPLNDLFEPVSELLGQLQLEKLLEPLNEWYARLQAELDTLSVSALLKPVADLHTQLTASLEAVSPEALLRPIAGALADLKGAITSFDFGSLTRDLSEVIGRVRAAVDQISPDRLFTPLVTAFDKLMAALDSFNPSTLLQPVLQLFDRLADALAGLVPDDVLAILQAFAPLVGMPATLDPRQAFSQASLTYRAAGELLGGMNVGRLLADVKSPFDALNASFRASAGGSDVSLSVRVEGLDPMRHEGMTRAIADLQTIRGELTGAFTAAPPAELVAKYEEIHEDVQKLVPSWVLTARTADDVRRAFQLANPLNVGAEINRVWDAVKDQLKNLDPRILRDQLTEAFERIKDALLIDPQVIATELNGITARVAGKLDALDIDAIGRDLASIMADIRAVVAALDPRPILQRLDSVTAELKQVIEALNPAQLLSGLQGPFDTAKAIVEEFDPKGLVEPLEVIFADVRTILLEIDIGVLLEPLSKRLDEIRDELEEALSRTESAFGEMLGAVPSI